MKRNVIHIRAQVARLLYKLIPFLSADFAGNDLKEKNLKLSNYQEQHEQYNDNKLKESIRQSTLLDNLPDIVMEVDSNKIYTWANHAGLEFFGNDVIGREASYYFEGPQNTYFTVNDLFVGKATKCYVESWQRRIDGQIRLLAWHCNAMKNHDGTLAGILSTAKDITDWHLSKENLKASEEHFRIITSNTPDHIIINDLQLKYTMVINPQLGLTIEEMIGKTDMELLGAEEGKHLMEIKKQVISSRKPYYLETSLKNKQNQEEFFSGSFIPKYDTNNNVEGLIGYFRNVTKEKQVEFSLKHSEERFRLLAYLLPIGVYLTDSSGNYIYTNKIWNEMAGMVDGSASGPAWIKALHPDDKEAVVEKWNATLAHEKNWIHEYRLMTPEGKISWVSGLAIPHRDSEGKIINYIGVNIDITDQKAAQLALKESESRYRNLLDQYPDSIVIHDGRKILYANQAAAINMDLESADMLLGKEVIDFVHPKYKDMIVQRMRNIFEHRDIGGLVHEKFITPKGKTIDVETFAIPIVFNGIPGIQLIIRNITDRLKMEQARMDMEKKYQSLFEYANDSIFLMNENSIIDCNAMTINMFACKKEEIIGRNPVHFSPEYQPDGTLSAEKAADKINSAMNGHVEYFEWKHTKADGTPFDAEITLNHIAIGDNKYLLATVRDISQRKKSDEKINAQLEELQRWQMVTIGREDRIRQLKKEVNDLLEKLGEPVKYRSQEI